MLDPITTKRLSLQLRWVSWGLILVFLARLLSSLMPFRLTEAGWYVGLGGQLVNTSPVVITALCLWWLSYHLDPDPEEKPRLHADASWLLQRLIRISFGVVIPLQIVATVVVLQQLAQQEQVQRKEIAEKVAKAETTIRALPNLTPAQRRERVQTVDRQVREVLRVEYIKNRQRNLGLLVELTRVCVSAVAIVWALRWPRLPIDDEFWMPPEGLGEEDEEDPYGDEER